MLRHSGWIGCALAAGLLLQIAVQIRWLHWLPDFPIYPALALLSGIAALFTVPAAFKQRWFVWLSGAAFVLLAMAHAALAANASSTAIERWRDAVLWPTLFSGLATCLLAGTRWPTSLLLIWTLGEAAVAILACWYAPSFGESPSLRGYQYVLIAGTVSVLLCGVLLWLGPRSSAAWLFLLMLVIPLVILVVACLVQPVPSAAQPLLMGLAGLRFVLIAFVGYRWIRDDATKTGKDESLPRTG